MFLFYIILFLFLEVIVMAYVAPTIRSVGDAVTAADYNIMANDVLDHESRILTTGLVLVNTTSFTSVTSVTTDSVFSATNNYRLIISFVQNTSVGGFSLDGRLSGATQTSYNQAGSRIRASGGPLFESNSSSSQASWSENTNPAVGVRLFSVSDISVGASNYSHLTFTGAKEESCSEVTYNLKGLLGNPLKSLGVA
jgi:hypothetical protein